MYPQKLENLITDDFTSGYNVVLPKPKMTIIPRNVYNNAR